MNPDYERNLERQIDRALKALPELPAPNTLCARVMAAVAARQALPWYRQPWQNWSLTWRAVSMTFLLLSFGGFCVAAWQLTQAAGYTAAMAEVKQVFSGIGLIWHTVEVLLGALVLVCKQLGTAFMIGCLVAVGIGYAICVGLGTVCVRLALAHR
jgi:hypothetical protein